MYLWRPLAAFAAKGRQYILLSDHQKDHVLLVLAFAGVVSIMYILQ